LKMTDCFKVMCDFWKKQEVKEPTVVLQNNLLSGNCSIGDNHWHKTLTNSFSCG